MTNVPKLRNLLLKIWTRAGRVILKGHYVFVHKDESKLQLLERENECIHFFDSFDEVTENIVCKIKEALGPDYDKTLRSLFLEKSRLYVLMLDDEFGSMGWIQFGRNLSRWWVEIDQNDFVMYSAVTNPKLRGQHLWGRVLAAAYRQENKNCSRILCKGIIKKISISNRSSFYCNSCQN